MLILVPKRTLATVVLPVIVLSHAVLSFQTMGWVQRQTKASAKLAMAKESEERYQNKVAELFSNLLPGKAEENDDTLAGIDFDAPKRMKKESLEALAEALDSELYQAEWFVTGKVNPIYFSDTFQFRDPDVSVNGIEGESTGGGHLCIYFCKAYVLFKSQGQGIRSSTHQFFCVSVSFKPCQ
jgi:hypothetical protein